MTTMYSHTTWVRKCLNRCKCRRQDSILSPSVSKAGHTHHKNLSSSLDPFPHGPRWISVLTNLSLTIKGHHQARGPQSPENKFPALRRSLFQKSSRWPHFWPYFSGKWLQWNEMKPIPRSQTPHRKSSRAAALSLCLTDPSYSPEACRKFLCTGLLKQATWVAHLWSVPLTVL